MFAQIATNTNDKEILPSFLTIKDSAKKLFSHSYIYGRFTNNGMKLFNNIDFTNWSFKEKCNFFLYLPFQKEVWKKQLWN